MKVNFKDVQSGSSVVPEGVFNVEVEKIEYNTEKGYYNWQFNIISADEIEGNFAGRKLWAFTSLKENALWKLKQFLEALGESEEDLSSEEFEFDPEKYIGAGVKAIVKHREYMGKIQPDVDSLVGDNQEEQLSIFS